MSWKPIDDSEAFPTLGYDAADWMSEFLLRPDTSDYEPFIPTQEQLEFLVRLYELDPITGQRVRHRAVLSRPRGWGKSPFLAAIACFEAMGPAICDGYDANGQPVGIPWEQVRTPTIQVTATTDDQTANTWRPLLEMLRDSPAIDEYDLEVMDSFVALRRGRIETRSASATSVKGARAVCAILDQTETWLPGNGGKKLAQTLRNNATKLGGVTIESPNAYTIGENSVAEMSAQTWENVKSGKARGDIAKVLLYDHRGAPFETDITDKDSLIHGLRVAYGDSANDTRGCIIHDPPCAPGWVDLERVALDFWDTSNDPAVMCADFLNQISAASNSWVTMPEMRAIEDVKVKVGSKEPVTLGFDGSEGRKIGIADATVLIGYSLTQHHLFKIGCWQQPDGPAGEGWQPPKLEIEQTVREAFERFNIVGFYADPSAGWAGEVKTWEATYNRQLKARMSTSEPIRYRQRDVTATCEGFAQLLSAIRSRAVTYDGSPEMTAHFLNARLDPRRGGYVLAKPVDDQDYSKIDCAWGAMMAYRAGLDAIGKKLDAVTTFAPRRLY